MTNSIEVYVGALIAESMAQAVYHEHLRSALVPEKRERKMLSAVRHSDGNRDKFAGLAHESGKKLADLPSGDPATDDLLWAISFYSKPAKSGLDPWLRLSPKKVKAAIIVRALKNDARRLKRTAYALCQTEFDRQSLALAAMTAPTRYDYKDWAKGVVND